MSRQMDRAAFAASQWRRELPSLDVTAMEVIGRLNETAVVLGRDHIEPVFARHGLQRGEFDVLATLRRSGAPYALTPTDLYQATMLSSGGMTARLDKLEASGLIARRPNPQDRRGTIVELTEAGRTVTEAALKEHADNETRMLSALSPEEQAQLGDLLGKLLAALTRSDAG